MERFFGLGTRFFASLLLLLAGLLGVTVVSLYGLDRVRQANDQVYLDNLRTANLTDRLARDLTDTRRVASQLAIADDAASSARLRASMQVVQLPRVNHDISRVLAIHHGDDVDELRTIRRIPQQWQAVRSRIEALDLVDSAAPAATRAAARRIAASLDPLVAFVFARGEVELHDAAIEHSRAGDVFSRARLVLLIAASLAILVGLVMVRIGLRLRRLVHQQHAHQRHGEAESAFVAALQVTENEDEAQELLRRHLERLLAGARAVILVRNNSDDRLEARTTVEGVPGLRESLTGATPRSCLAVRFAREQTQGPANDPLIGCELCGSLPGASQCQPLVVSGEVIGSVLVNRATASGDLERGQLRDAVGQAAPVLANLRNLALAEVRAATDALTGLPNQRAVQDTLKRMVAQASRMVTPLAALLIDLDHFKRINDVHGHERGDEALAAVGVTLRNVIRMSDFAGRYGGEEFVLLLPGTDEEGALHVAEAIRQSIASIILPNRDLTLTASIGVAILPRHAGDSVTLFRAADRALYAAKQNGRNRVELATVPARTDGVAEVPQAV